MSNLLTVFASISQSLIGAQKRHQKKIRSTTGKTSMLEQDGCSSERPQYSIWQVALPLCGVLTYLIGAITTVYMTDGQYIFHLKVSLKGLEITTVVDKRDANPIRDTKKQEGAEVQSLEGLGKLGHRINENKGI